VKVRPPWPTRHPVPDQSATGLCWPSPRLNVDEMDAPVGKDAGDCTGSEEAAPFLKNCHRRQRKEGTEGG
jgi:hypothetical protein